MPKETLARCSVRAERRADPMLGTAFPAARLLLVEQPGPWGRDGLLRSRFDPGVAREVVQRAERLGVRVLAIRRPGRPVGERRRWAVADCRPGREQMVWGSFAEDAELLELSLDRPPGVPLTDPAASVFLVCTHGSHDACCALRGRPVAAALAGLRPDRVWECSHVGGDRFAANVLVLPSGLLYGTVHTTEATDLVAATERGEVLAAPLRGKVGLSPESQAALAHVQRQWAGTADGYRVLSSVRTGPASARVRIEHRGVVPARLLDVDVRWHRSEVHRLTCQMTSPATVLVYEPVGMVEVSAA
ncbi:sucrase ferredoxin [Nakamurella endophytica]|uniref:sucrase ferredoxin n=1 Tax=Nakamurella endophytica TaxID=1748367 RepID=UPI001662E5E5|nr:sucrase ferredoxin [Nakamurella endophytica]